MQKIVWAAASALLFFSCSPAGKSMGTNKLSREQKDEGWKLLFNGKNTKGWHKYGGGSIDSVWSVKDGKLWLDTKTKKERNIRGDWDIVTDDELDKFHPSTGFSF